MALLAAIARHEGAVAVFMPQLLNYEVLTSGKPYGWLPFVRDKDLKELMGVYNAALKEVVVREGAHFVAGLLTEDWAAADFINDEGNFSAHGNSKCAQIVADYIRDKGL